MSSTSNGSAAAAAAAAEAADDDKTRRRIHNDNYKYVKRAEEVAAESPDTPCAKALELVVRTLLDHLKTDDALAAARRGSPEAAAVTHEANKAHEAKLNFKKADLAAKLLAARVFHLAIRDGKPMDLAARFLLGQITLVTDDKIHQVHNTNNPPAETQTVPDGFSYIGRVPFCSPGLDAALLGDRCFMAGVYATTHHAGLLWCRGYLYSLPDALDVFALRARGGYCRPVLLCQNICACDQPVGKPPGQNCNINLACTQDHIRKSDELALFVHDPLWPTTSPSSRIEKPFILDRLRSGDARRANTIKSCAGCGNIRAKIGGGTPQQPVQQPDDQPDDQPDSIPAFKVCAGCTRVINAPPVVYCGQACQRKHWSKHKHFCCKNIASKHAAI